MKDIILTNGSRLCEAVDFENQIFNLKKDKMGKENLNLGQNQPFCKTDIMRCFNSSDVGKVFWRVESYGVLTQCLIYELKDDNQAVIRLAVLTDLRNQEYKLKTEIEYWGSSTYGTDTLQKSNQYYYDFEEAKKTSLDRYMKEVNPNGIYKVARYFDDVFECFVTGELLKKDAQIKCNEFNSKPRTYVSYGLISIA